MDLQSGLGIVSNAWPGTEAGSNWAEHATASEIGRLLEDVGVTLSRELGTAGAAAAVRR